MNSSTIATNQSISTSWLVQYQADLLAKAIAIDARLSQADAPIAYVTTVIGLPANVLIVLTTLWGSVTFNSMFRWTMIATAIADFLHVLLKDMRMFARMYWNATSAYQILSGIAYFFSLFSDLLALVLTIDRFIGMVFPVFYQSVRRQTKLFVWVIVTCVLVLISATRLHYAFATYFLVSSTFVNSQWFASLTYFSDTIVPFLLLATSVVLVFVMVFVLRKRFNEQKKNRSMEKIINERIKEMRKTTSLMMSLLFLCILNQIGYVYYEICFMLNQRCGASAATAESEVYNCYVIKVAYAASAHFSMYFESLSKSVNFYLYIGFNKTFRQSFNSIFVRCRPAVTSSGNTNS